jgi:acyl-CoA synthetase (AMP-forming)/AMP-acid ligase II
MEGSERMRGDLEWGTIPGLLRASAARYGDREAIVDGDTRISYGQLDELARQAAAAFIAAGVEPGDRVAIWAPNMHEWIPALMGLQAAGGVLVPLNTRYKGTEAGYILAKSRARLLVTVEGFLDTDYLSLLRSAQGGVGDDRPVRDLPHLEQVVVLRGRITEGSTAWKDFLARGDGIGATDVDDRLAGVTSDDLSDVLFTSGTTGNPKGVMCTHGQTLRAFQSWSEVVGLREGDRYLIVNPFFHAFGYKAGIVAALMSGATIVPEPVFDVPTVMASVVREQISMLPAPPTLYQTILNHPDLASFDLTSLRLAVTGAAAIPVSLVEDMRSRLGFETVITGYGLTEATGIATMCRHDDDAVTIATTSGRAIPDVEVLVVDDGGREVPAGEPGEIVVRGYNVMSGYFEEPDETAATVDDDGWLHTGDIGVMDERGYIKITDRKKDMFIMGGFNAYPTEIENLLLGHDQIAQVAVIGVPDERMGEVGMAHVIPVAGTTIDVDELRAWCRDNMANFKVPRYFEVVETLPVNPSGKVVKYQLRDEAIDKLGLAGPSEA